MRTLSLALMFALGTAVCLAGCGEDDPLSSFDDGGTSADGGPVDHTFDGLTALVITPENAVLEATPTQAASQPYTITGKFEGKPDVDLTTKLALHYIPLTGNEDLGTFDKNTFVSSTSAGGSGNVTAGVKNISAKASLTVHLSVDSNGPDNGQALPQNPGKNFQGTANAAHAPTIYYPNDGVMLPPNLNRLEVHWVPKSTSDKLFQLSFTSPTATVNKYLRCTEPTNGGCIFELDSETYTALSDSNRGGPPVKLRVRASDDAGTAFGESAEFNVTFAENKVEGGIYYWTTTLKSIMRFDFGGTETKPEAYLTPADTKSNTCVGCHAISPDGTKLVASIDGQNAGYLVYVKDISKPKPLTVDGDTTMGQRIQFASFNPAGDRFAAVYGDVDAPDRNNLYFHDGTTGKRITAETIAFPFEPDHPSWSPDGNMIALSRVGLHNTSQRPGHCGIELIRRSNDAWGASETIVPQGAGLNRYNPNFSPDAQYLVFSESRCPGTDDTSLKSADCDGDADDSAKTWAVLPNKGATPVLLAAAGKPGVGDGTNKDLADTFPRFSPFAKDQGTGKLHWATISSRRRVGLRDPGGKQYLWMFALDPAKVAAGQDPSYPAFYLPFQDPETSNHIGQWTKKVIKVQPPN